MMSPVLRGTVGSHFCKPIEQCISRLHRGESHYRDEVPWRKKHTGKGGTLGKQAPNQNPCELLRHPVTWPLQGILLSLYAGYPLFLWYLEVGEK